MGQELSRRMADELELSRRMAELQHSADATKAGASTQLERLKGDMQRHLVEARAEGAQMVQRLSAAYQAKLTEVITKESRDGSCLGPRYAPPLDLPVALPGQIQT